MSAKKKKGELQSNLFALAYAPRPAAPAPVDPPAAPKPDTFMPFPPERAPISNEVDQPAPPVRSVDRRPDGIAITPCIHGNFVVARVRDNGTTFVEWTCSRSELEQLVHAGTEALR